MCTDVLVRAFRAVGEDLQKLVHEDILAAPAAYPRLAGRRPDANIDHRRVPNLMAFFGRHGRSLPLSREARDYLPGDVVAWDLGGGTLHIGLVVEGRGARPGIVHNIGRGPMAEDVLFSWKVIGHYRYLP